MNFNIDTMLIALYKTLQMKIGELEKISHKGNIADTNIHHIQKILLHGEIDALRNEIFRLAELGIKQDIQKNKP